MTVVGLNDEIWSSEVDSKNLGPVSRASPFTSQHVFSGGVESKLGTIKVCSTNDKDIGTLKMLFCTENNLDPNEMVLSKNNQLFRDELQDRNDLFLAFYRFAVQVI